MSNPITRVAVINDGSRQDRVSECLTPAQPGEVTVAPGAVGAGSAVTTPRVPQA